MSVREILCVVLTWGTLSGVYLVLVGQASRDELVAGAVIAAVGTALSLAVRLGSGCRFRLGPSVWLRPVTAAMYAVPRDIALVGWNLARPRPRGGRLEEQPLQAAGRDETSERAVQMLATSFAPNRYVVGLVKGGRVLTHRLTGADE